MIRLFPISNAWHVISTAGDSVVWFPTSALARGYAQELGHPYVFFAGPAGPPPFDQGFIERGADRVWRDVLPAFLANDAGGTKILPAEDPQIPALELAGWRLVNREARC